MRALVYDAKGNINVLDWPDPQLEEDQALVKVKYAGICGSDLVAWNGALKRIVNPVVLGHEMVGDVVALGSEKDKQKFTVGQRVVVEPLISCGDCELCKTGNYHVCESLKVIGYDADGGMAQYISVPVKRLHIIPDHLTYEKAALCEPIAVAIHMSRRTGLKLGDKAAIIGAGPIGLALALVCKEAGASKIVLSERNKYRINLVREMGFEVINASENTESQIVGEIVNVLNGKADITFECAATVESLSVALQVTKIRGIILQGGVFKTNPTYDAQSITLKEQMIVGSRVYNYSDFESSIDLMTRHDMQLEKMITKIISIEDAVEQGFKEIKQGKRVMKILIAPN
ncbi:MAG: alcohol dehydrogenase catalytic domain-containing protein [Dethiobacter sp.]|jgi:2-desacetyl-2-hydroxyethyl bacteriochlorophyllide A dehydrogenase|nr:alcohol dehydrogenase catalytic domain-containing protein [Dethiobacter sp.]